MPARAVLPNHLMNTPRKPFSGPDPGRPDQFDPTLSGMSRGSPHSLFPSSTQDFLDQRV